MINLQLLTLDKSLEEPIIFKENKNLKSVYPNQLSPFYLQIKMNIMQLS